MIKWCSCSSINMQARRRSSYLSCTIAVKQYIEKRHLWHSLGSLKYRVSIMLASLAMPHHIIMDYTTSRSKQTSFISLAEPGLARNEQFLSVSFRQTWHYSSNQTNVKTFTLLKLGRESVPAPKLA